MQKQQAGDTRDDDLTGAKRGKNRKRQTNPNAISQQTNLQTARARPPPSKIRSTKNILHTFAPPRAMDYKCAVKLTPQAMAGQKKRAKRHAGKSNPNFHGNDERQPPTSNPLVVGGSGGVGGDRDGGAANGRKNLKRV